MQNRLLLTFILNFLPIFGTRSGW